MDLGAVDNLDVYMEARRAAECAYFDQYSKWKEHLFEECFNDLGLPRLDVEPVARFEELVEMVGIFALNCMKAYVRRVGTGGALEILDRMDEHRDALLGEVRTRKWTPAARRLCLLMEERELEVGWRQVEGVVDEWLWDWLQPLMWRENRRWNGGMPVMMKVLADDDEAARRRSMVDRFLQRCRSAFPTRSFTEAQISESAGLADNTLFKAWKSNSARSTKSSAQRFERIIAGSPMDFVALIDKPPKIRRKKQ